MPLLLKAAIFIGSVTNRLDYGAPCASDYIAARAGYVVGFNAKTHDPDWVAYRLTRDKLDAPKTGRVDAFRPDPDIPETAQLADYKGSGWSRGHMMPAADAKGSPLEMSETFLLTNIVPQDSRNNSGAWNRIEQMVRNFARGESSLYVITGPIFSKDKEPRYIGRTGVRVPDALYKVVLDETPPRKMIAFIVVNEDTKASPHQLTASVDEVEAVTGIDFFSALPDDEEARLEARSDFHKW